MCLDAACEAIRQLSVFMLTRRAAALAAMRPTSLYNEADFALQLAAMRPSAADRLRSVFLKKWGVSSCIETERRFVTA